jgi:hypothetical protein
MGISRVHINVGANKKLFAEVFYDSQTSVRVTTDPHDKIFQVLNDIPPEVDVILSEKAQKILFKRK